MSFTQFHHCKPLANIWGPPRSLESSKHDFGSYNLPPLIIPAPNEYASPPSSPSSLQSFSTAPSSTSGSPRNMPSAALYTKRDIWNSSFSNVEPDHIYSKSFHLTQLNDVYDRVPLDPARTSFSSSIDSFAPAIEQVPASLTNNQYFQPLPSINVYTSPSHLGSDLESPINSIPSTPVSSISSFDSTSPVSRSCSPKPPVACVHPNTHSHSQSSRKKSKKSDSKLNKKKLSLNTDLYKTELCSSFVKSGGFCPYGDKCQFAHGSHELKSIDRPSNWRSKPCQNWLKTGTCTYNERCCFRHN